MCGHVNFFLFLNQILIGYRFIPQRVTVIFIIEIKLFHENCKTSFIGPFGYYRM